MGYLIPIRAFPLLPILISSLLISNTFSDNSYLNTKCIRSYTKNSTEDTYASNLKKLFADLTEITPTTGFGNSSSGNHSDRAFGLSLCRGDVSTKDCAHCIDEASKKINESCPSSRAAIIWYDYCFLKYSDLDFFGQIDTDNKLTLLNTMNATDPEGFKKTTTELLGNLTRNASDPTNEHMFSRGTCFEENNNKTIYAMAQCSRDLSSLNCENCLDCAVNELPWNVTITGKQYVSPVGARTLTGSCSVRYETYAFLNN